MSIEYKPGTGNTFTSTREAGQLLAGLHTGGTKHDGGKPDLSLCPRVALEAMAKALMFGEQKYGRYQYLMGFESHRLIAAALRHLTAWQDGEDIDADSGNSHLAHALASIAMLLDCQDKGTLKDTRHGK
jgi:hypothetical protein